MSTNAQLLSILDTLIDPYLALPLSQVVVAEACSLSEADGAYKYKAVLTLPYVAQGRTEWFSEQLSEALDAKVEVELKSQIGSVRKATGEGLGQVANIVAISSGKGGVGKSTTTVNLALAMAAEGARVGIMDADIYGPSQGMMLGVAANTRPENQGDNAMLPVEALGVKSMSIAYLIDDNTPMVWRGPMASGALQQLFNQTLWGELDYLFVDMPPGTGDIQLTLSQKVPVAGAVVVTTPQDIALLDAKKGIEMFRKVDIPVLGVIENMSTHICSQCGHEEHIFGAGGGEVIAENYQTELLGSLPLTLEIRLSTDEGKPTVVADPTGKVAQNYREIARKLSAGLSELVEEQSSAPVIQIFED
ncbi:MAG: iron-sulfur cluster carrier protein ApbC [Pontibacterium sp.]